MSDTTPPEEGLIRLDSLNAMIHGLGHEMHKDSATWFGKEVADSLTILALGLGGESGEVLDIVKKVMRGSMTLEEARPLIIEELTDVFIYWSMLATLFQMDIEQSYAIKRSINMERFSQ